MRILLVDDHAIVRDGLRRLLLASFPHEVHEAADGAEALAALRRQTIDLVILDLNLPGLGGIELLRRVVQAQPKSRVLVFSMHGEPIYVSRALENGAAGYISKNISPEELLVATQKVAAGGRYIEQEIAQTLALGGAQSMEQLTARELEIMRLLGQGRSLAEIADTIGLGYKTVANTLTQMKAKLGVARTADLVRMAVETGVS
jgi:DNA-binding NarL/FixJ family response regulator